MEELPTDYTSGVDFRIVKTSKGGYADYSTSNWARRERPLTEVETAAVEKNGLYNLSDFLPKKPSEVEVKVMQEMFQASVDGEAYDAERFGQYFRPAGMAARTGDPQNRAPATAPAATTAPAPEATPAPVAEAAPAAVAQTAPAAEPKADNSAEDILAMIRSRQN